MKLYYDPASTTCRSVLFFVAEEKIDVELEYVSLFAGQNHDPAYAQLNPNRIVPFLVDGDLGLGESTAILQYLADKVSSPAYPDDLKDRARVNAALSWATSNLQKEFGFGVYPQVFPGLGMGLGTPEATADLVQGALGRSRRWFDVLDHALAESRFVCGGEITLADYTTLAIVCMGELISFDLSPWPNIRRWVAMLKARPSWAQVDAAFQGLQSALRAAA